MTDLYTRAVRFLLNQERADTMPRIEGRALIVGSVVALAGFAVTIVSTSVGTVLSLGDATVVVPYTMDACLFVAYPANWLLLRAGFARSGKLLVVLIALFHICAITVLFGTSSGVQFYCFPSFVIPLLLFPRHEWLLRVSTMSLVFAGFLAMLIYFDGYGGTPLTPLKPDAAFIFSMMNAILALAVLAECVYYFYSASLRAEEKLDEERSRSETLLLNILPRPVAERLKEGEGLIADRFESATVLFADLVGFTPLSARMSAEDVLRLLNDIFSDFDRLIEAHRLEKIKTIGDAYMAVGGVPEADGTHARRVVAAALAMQQTIIRRNAAAVDPVQLRIGVHSGPLVAGVIGSKRFIYDLWGDTVNTASRMESHGLPGEVHVSNETRLLSADAFAFESRGVLEIKGKGTMETFFVRGAA